jgi:WD40 repeat protein
VWDVGQGEALHAYRPTDHPLDTAAAARHYEAVAPLTQETFAAAALDQVLVLRRITDGEAVRILKRTGSAEEPQPNEVRDLAVSPDCSRVVSAAGDGRLTLWNLKTSEALRTGEGHADIARVVSFGSDGDRLFSGGDDGTLKIWDAQSGTLRATLSSPDAGPLRGIALLSKEQVLAGYEAGLLIIWDVATRREVCRMKTQGEGLRGLAVTEEARRVIVADNQRAVRVWELAAVCTSQSAPAPVVLVRLESALRSLTYSPETNTLLVGDCVGGVNCLHLVENDQ